VQLTDAAAPLSAYTPAGLSREGRYPLLSGLEWDIVRLSACFFVDKCGQAQRSSPLVYLHHVIATWESPGQSMNAYINSIKLKALTLIRTKLRYR
jgi:hypothetical protein